MSIAPHDQLSPWIRAELAAGKSSQQIAQNLLAAGWAAADVRTALAQATGNPAVSPPARMTIDVSNYPRDGYVTPQSTSNSPRSPSSYSRPAGYSASRSPEERQAALRLLFIGSLSFGGGLAVTLITYSLAANGGIYIIAWGAILYGLIDMVRGLAGLL